MENLSGCNAKDKFEKNHEKNDDETAQIESQDEADDDDDMWDIDEILESRFSQGKVRLRKYHYIPMCPIYFLGSQSVRRTSIC